MADRLPIQEYGFAQHKRAFRDTPLPFIVVGNPAIYLLTVHAELPLR